MSELQQRLRAVHLQLRKCRKCPNVCGRAVHGPALSTKVMLVGQAPGTHEEHLGRPFAYTAGKTLFKWLGEATGATEEELREIIYFTAVARCFPGKAKGGKGDRVPSPEEIENCSVHLKKEVIALKPSLILAVGKVAIGEVLRSAGINHKTPLEKVVGRKIKTEFHGHKVNVIALPHPSGISVWPHTPVGKKKLAQALKLLRQEIDHFAD